MNPLFLSSYFTWSGFEGVTDLTDLPAELISYLNPTPVAIFVKSVRTGKVVKFHFVTALNDNVDREITGWHFVSSDGIVINIIND